MTWNGLYEALFDKQGRPCMVQVQLAPGEPAMLSAFGRLEGGPVVEWDDYDALVLELVGTKGAAGAIMLQEHKFQGIESASRNSLTVLHGGVRLLFTFVDDRSEAFEAVDPFATPAPADE